MKTTTVTVLALLLLLAAVVIVGPMLVAQPPGGAAAQPSTTIMPFAVGIVALGVLAWLSLSIFRWGAANLTETTLDSTASAQNRLAPTLCWIGVVLSVLQIVATVVASILSLTPGHDEGGRGMALGIVYFMAIPAAAILAGLFCLVGRLMCKNAMRSNPSRAHQTALRFATRVPVIGMMWWIAGLVLMVGFGH